MIDLMTISKSDWITTNWSGGTTSEIFIFPKTADFKKGDYQLRISIATVDIESTTYTSLPGASRTLLVLEGHLHLNHLNEHRADLHQYEQDSFLGDWTTESIGKVTNFNVMTKGAITSSVQFIDSATINGDLKLKKGDFIYLIKGEVSLGKAELAKSESIHIANDTNNELKFIKETKLILVRTKFN